jgi:catechol 2,3-dioxygenase-like lactoylglutathione lyase family enzyme
LGAVAEFKLDHIAFGVPDVAPVAELLAGHLGGSERGSGPGGGFVFWQWEFANGGAIEIIVPDGPPGGFLHRFLAARGSGPHHVTFKVPEIHAALDRARANGYEPVGFDDRFPGWKEAFLHPKQAQGIVVQLAEAHPELDAEMEGADFVRPPYPVTARAAATVSVVGLLLSSRSEERALRQWRTLLGGALARERERLVFRWPDSPLRIAVRVQPDAEEGPLALEIAAPRRIALPEGPHPALSLPIVQVEER